MGTTAGPMVPPVTRTMWWWLERPGRRSPQLPPQQPASQPPAWAIRPAVPQPSPSERRPRGRVPLYPRARAAADRQPPQRHSAPTYAAVYGPQRSRRSAAACQKWLPAPVVHRQVRLTTLPQDPSRVTCLLPADIGRLLARNINERQRNQWAAQPDVVVANHVAASHSVADTSTNAALFPHANPSTDICRPSSAAFALADIPVPPCVCRFTEVAAAACREAAAQFRLGISGQHHCALRVRRPTLLGGIRAAAEGSSKACLHSCHPRD